ASDAARAIRSAEAETLCQEPGAGMRLAVRVGLDGLTRTVRRHDVERTVIEVNVMRHKDLRR
ncbi:MAG: hypothetical protein ACO1SX_13775, partial [Actinomycetota bacterium]